MNEHDQYAALPPTAVPDAVTYRLPGGRVIIAQHDEVLDWWEVVDWTPGQVSELLATNMGRGEAWGLAEMLWRIALAGVA